MGSNAPPGRNQPHLGCRGNTDAPGLRIPVVVVPFVNSALAAHPTFQRSVALLRDTGIDVIHGPGRLEPHPPGTGASSSTRSPGIKHLTRPIRSSAHMNSQQEIGRTLRVRRFFRTWLALPIMQDLNPCRRTCACSCWSRSQSAGSASTPAARWSRCR
jgi:hypothetical protein